ncbi:hypothetical protein UlMin_017856 [Ulmus minor]
MKFSGKVLRSSDTYTNSFESPKSLPKNYAIFPHSKFKYPLTKGSFDILFEIRESPLEPDSFGKIRSSSLDSCRTISCMSGVNNSSPNSAPLKFCLENKVTIAQVGLALQFTGGNPNLNQLSGPKHISILGSLDSGNGFIRSISTSEIELSEDYTYVISHGPNPNQQRYKRMGEWVCRGKRVFPSCNYSRAFKKFSRSIYMYSRGRLRLSRY